MDPNNLLNNIASQPGYVLLFVAFMGYLWLSHRQSIAYAIQGETIKQALLLAAAGQTEANRLRDESNRQSERWLHMIETMNERFIMAITGQTGVMTGQAKRLDTIDTSLSVMPGLATGAAVSAVSDKVSIGLEILKLLGVDVGDLAKHASNPTAATQNKVDQIADKAGQPPPAPETTPAPAAVPVSDALTLPVTVTLTAAEPPA